MLSSLEIYNISVIADIITGYVDDLNLNESIASINKEIIEKYDRFEHVYPFDDSGRIESVQICVGNLSWAIEICDNCWRHDFVEAFRTSDYVYKPFHNIYDCMCEYDNDKEYYQFTLMSKT